MPLGMEVGLSLGDFVLDGDPAPFPKRRRSPGAEPPIFGPCLLWKFQQESSLYSNVSAPHILKYHILVSGLHVPREYERMQYREYV